MNKISIAAKRLLSLTMALCMLMTISSCDDDISEIGFTTRPDNDIIHVVTDTLQCGVATGYRDSIYVRTGYPLLGNITDPEYGSIKAGYLAQFYASTKLGLTYHEGDTITFDILRTSVPQELGLDTKNVFKSRFDSLMNNDIDSLTLRIYYNTYYGDSLSPMQLSVYALNKDARLEKEPEKAFYSNYDFTKFYSKDNLLGKKAYTAANRTLSEDDRKTAGSAYIEIRLDENFKNSFFRSAVEAAIARDKDGKASYPAYKDIFSSIESMRENFLSGVAIQPSFGDGSIIKVYNTAIWFYYRSYHRYNKDGTILRNATDTADSTYVTSHVQVMAVTPDVVQMASLGLKDIKKEDRLQDKNNAYITSPQGYYTTVDIPLGHVIRHMMDHESRKDSAYFLGGANFYLMCEKPQGALLSSTPVEHVMMVEESHMNRFFEESKIPEAKSAAIGTYVADSVNTQLYYYTFGNLSTLVLGLASEKEYGGWNKAMSSPIEWAKNIQQKNPFTFLPWINLSSKTNEDYRNDAALRAEVQKALDNYTVRMAIIPVDVTSNAQTGAVLSVSNYILPTAIKVKREAKKQFLQYIYTLGGAL